MNTAPMKYSLLKKLVAIALTLTMLAACGSESADSGPAVEVDPDAPKSIDDPSLHSGPLLTYLGIDTSGGQEAVMRERQREGERVVAECMAREGFEYTPAVIEDTYFSKYEEALKPWSVEWVEKYGLGISTQRFGQSEVGPNLVGYSDEHFITGRPTPSPNDTYRESLTEGEREAYSMALHGDMSQLDENSSWEPQGCQGEGFNVMFGDMFNRFEEFSTEFATVFEDLEARLEADERITEWQKKVSTCMSGKGHAYTNMEDTRNQINNRLSSVGNRAAYELPDGFDDMSEAAQQAALNESRKIPADQLDILAEVQQDEIALAKDLVACGGGELNKAIFAKPIQTEYEQEFLTKNEEGLSKFKGLFDTGG